MSGKLRSALHAARIKANMRWAAVTMKVRENDMFMTITYLLKPIDTTHGSPELSIVWVILIERKNLCRRRSSLGER